MIKYRISKYSPQYRNEKGEYIRNDWTSYADIGKNYDFGKLTLKKYIAIENNYSKVLELIFLENNIHDVFVTELECSFTIEKLRNMFAFKGMELSKSDIQIIDSLRIGSVVSFDRLKQFISLILRDCFWCKLENESQRFTVEFGYDLYVYVICDILTKQTIQQAESLGIYIERI